MLYTGGLPHNIRLFVPDSGRGAHFLPWDMDFAMSGATNASLFPSGNNLGRLIASNPAHRRRYLGHVRHLCETVFKVEYLSPWLTRYGAVVGQSYSSAANYVTARRNHARTQYPATVLFAITTNDGAAFSTEASEVALEGTAWIDAHEIRLGGLPLTLAWPTLTRWQVTVPLAPGPNPLTLEAYDHVGSLLATQSLTVTRATPAETGFAAWRVLHFTPAELTDSAFSGPTGDPTGAGLPNFLRYAFGLAPRAAIPASLLTVTTADSRGSAVSQNPRAWKMTAVRGVAFQATRLKQAAKDKAGWLEASTTAWKAAFFSNEIPSPECGIVPEAGNWYFGKRMMMRFLSIRRRASGSRPCRALAGWLGAALPAALGWAMAAPGGWAAQAAGEAPPASPKDHWSYQPVQRPAVPQHGDPWARGEIDAFILARLREKNLAPSAEADRRTMIRRLYLVMHGLPPSPEEVEAFVADADPAAYEKLVDRVLASPHYGERWARHWLDVARYADSNGFETNRERKTAWPYRDYVIEAFNTDKPYDRFIREQLAGDVLGADAATGFLVAGPYDVVKSPDPTLTLMQREDELTDMVNATGTAFLGVTMSCARCHDHKFDPVPQTDYFAMQAVFAGVNHGERPWRGTDDPEREQTLAMLRDTIAAKEKELAAFRQRAAEGSGAPGLASLRPPVNTRLNVEEFAPVTTTAVRFTTRATNGGEPCLDELEVYDETGRNIALAAHGGVPSASGTLEGYPIHRLEHLNDGRTGNARSWISNAAQSGWVQITFPAPAAIHRVIWSRDREEAFGDRLSTEYEISVATDAGQWVAVASSDDREPFDGKDTTPPFLKQLPEKDATAARAVMRELAETRRQLATLKEGEKAWLGVFEQPGPTHRLHRGDPTQPREVVAPGALSLWQPPAMAEDEPEAQRRLRLAEWIANPAHPLTARVMANRLWHYIFGAGLVDTPSDLGVNGSRPTHPELLDWLADEFVRSGWSVKHVQRLILRSAAFRQSSMPREDALAADASSRLLWRFPPRRLEAEAIRDSMLAASGALNLQAGGPGFYLMDVEVENVMHYYPKEEFTPAEFRRMVYQFRIRQTNDGVFGSFDCPDGSQLMPHRSRSTTPLQALNLFNSRFVLQQADLLARRLRAEAGDRPEAQARRAFELFYARPPDAFEQRQSAAFIREQSLEAFARALYNTSEFLFVF